MIRRAGTILVSWIAFAGLLVYVCSFVASFDVNVPSPRPRPSEDVDIHIAAGGCAVKYTDASMDRNPRDRVRFGLFTIEHGPLRWTATRNRSDFTYYHRKRITFPLSTVLIVPCAIAIILAVRGAVRAHRSGGARPRARIGLGHWLRGGVTLTAIGSIAVAWLSLDRTVEMDATWSRQSARHSAGLTFDRDIASLRLNTEEPYNAAPGWFLSPTPQWATQFGAVSARSYPVPAWTPPTFLSMFAIILLLHRPIRTWRRRRNGLCLQCGYDLTGLPEPRCPECGREFDDSRGEG